MSDHPVVVKLGGTTIAEQRDVLSELTRLYRERPVVVVHGGGKRLTLWLDRLDVKSRFDGGRRVTDEAALEVAVAVLGGLVNTELVTALRALGADAVGIRGADGGLIGGPRSPQLERVIAEPVTRPALLQELMEHHRLPVLAPMGIADDGLLCNVNADDAAASVCAALGGELLLLTDTDGVLDEDGRRIPVLTREEAEELVGRDVIAGGMVPKVRSALRALDGGSVATAAVIADGRGRDALHRALAGAAGTTFRIS